MMIDRAEEVFNELRKEGKARKIPHDKIIESQRRIDEEMRRFMAEFHRKQGESMIEASKHVLTSSNCTV